MHQRYYERYRERRLVELGFAPVGRHGPTRTGSTRAHDHDAAVPES